MAAAIAVKRSNVFISVSFGFSFGLYLPGGLRQDRAAVRI
jgi:hypothetical protein